MSEAIGIHHFFAFFLMEGGGANGCFLLRLLLAATVAASLTCLSRGEFVGVERSRRTDVNSTPVVFNFGDSNSDTGGYSAGLGYSYDLPYGRVFFRRANGRSTDGRLVIDFLCEKMKMGLLRPYLDSLGSSFINGANFAIIGTYILPKGVPFSLFIQTLQFTRFRSRTLELTAQGRKDLPNAQGFRNAVYMYDIGQNDLSGFFYYSLNYSEILLRIPYLVSEIGDSIQSVYDQGGRKFWVHNTGPLGCLPEKLSLYHKVPSDVDEAGCLIACNKVAKAFNSALDALCDELRVQLHNASIVYTDIYSIKYDIVSNYTRYGFASGVMACCGHGGPPYNLDRNISCLEPGHQVCSDGSKYVSWDGIHYTDAANAIVASKILSGNYSKPRIKFGELIHMMV